MCDIANQVIQITIVAEALVATAKDSRYSESTQRSLRRRVSCGRNMLPHLALVGWRLSRAYVMLYRTQRDVGGCPIASSWKHLPVMAHHKESPEHSSLGEPVQWPCPPADQRMIHADHITYHTGQRLSTTIRHMTCLAVAICKTVTLE